MKLLLILICVLLTNTIVFAQNGENTQKNAWTFGATGRRHLLQAYGDNDLSGKSAAVSLGYAYIQEKWFFHGTLDSIIGPFEPMRDEQLNVDYYGTGFSTTFGISFKELGLRNTSSDHFVNYKASYGLLMGMTYADIVGRSVGKNRELTDNPDDERNLYLIRDYSSKITNFSISPGLFAIWLSPPRPQGNTPELLKTRVEGYMLSFTCEIPVISYYSNAYKTSQKKADGTIEMISVKEKGSFTGYNMVLSFFVFLGS